MTGADPVKILTVGAAVGSIRELFSKVEAINAKHGKFDLLLCTGDFFGPVGPSGGEQPEDEVVQLLAGQIKPPIECYIMQGDQPLPEKVVERFAATGGELCKDIFLMSKSGTVTTAHGLRVACIGGVHEPQIYASSEAAPGFLSPFFSRQTVERLLSNAFAKSSAKQSYSSLAAIQTSSSESQDIDILLSNSWPTSIAHFLPTPPPATFQLESNGASPLDDVIRKTRPRYHFVAAGGSPPVFWEREPYLWEGENQRVSRFVSLGAFGNAPATGKKQRWFYAFSITPGSPALPAPSKPANATRNPFIAVLQRSGAKRPLEEAAAENFIWGAIHNPAAKRTKVQSGGESGLPPPGYKCRRCESTEHFISDCPDRQKPPENYVCKICGTPGHFVRDCPTRDAKGDTGGKKPKQGYVCRACGSEDHYLEDCLVANQRQPRSDHRGSRRGPPKEISVDECWFCLSNPNLAKHLIVSIGSECYVTLPKGQIVPTHQEDYATLIPGGGHLLIVPITHYPTFSTIPPDIATPIIDETESYKAALRSFYAKHGAAAVVFEVGRLSAKGGHAHVQVVPVPLKLQDKVEEAFIKAGGQLGVDFESDPDTALEICQGGRASYFRVDLPDGRKMVHVMKDTIPFSIQFGRQVMVALLDMPDRFDWKACMQSEEDDRADAQAFKAAFAPFDPSI